MKTDNIYIGELGFATKIKYDLTVYDYYFVPEIHKKVKYKIVKYIIVKQSKNFCGEYIAKDLNTNKKYMCELPISEGALFVPKEHLIPFNDIYPYEPTNLPKKKVLEMGKEAIMKLIKNKNKK